MTNQKAKLILKKLEKRYPNSKIILKYSNKFELLVSVILSAQTTDIQVNKVTSSLFPKYRLKNKKYSNDYSKYSRLTVPNEEVIEIVNFKHAPIKVLEKDIKSIGLYKNKAKNIKLSAKMLLHKFDGKLPKTIEEMIKLPGVGRKTANVVLGNAYGIVEGIAVDTHVARLSLKYGFSKSKDPLNIERDLMKLFDKKDWFRLTYLLIEHGRSIRKTKKDFIEKIKLS